MSHPRPSPRIAILGLRGSGKSTVAPLLADRLHIPWWDTDRWVADHLAPPPELIVSGRTADLRAAEVAAIVELSRLPAAVLSLGGGAVETPGALDPLRSWQGILLDAPDAELARRIEADTGPRPPLTDRPLLEEIAILRSRRWALYTAIDPLIIATASRSPESIVDEVLHRLG